MLIEKNCENLVLSQSVWVRSNRVAVKAWTEVGSITRTTPKITFLCLLWNKATSRQLAVDRRLCENSFQRRCTKLNKSSNRLIVWESSGVFKAAVTINGVVDWKNLDSKLQLADREKRISDCVLEILILFLNFPKLKICSHKCCIFGEKNFCDNNQIFRPAKN